MKNRTLYLIFLAIYLVSFGMGFAFSGLRQANAKLAQQDSNRQANWILVHVDDMTIAHPRLVSVWGLFLTFTPGPQLYFKSFYMSGQNYDKPPELARVFSVKADRTLSKGFMQALDHLNYRRDGLVILDGEAFDQFVGWAQRPIEIASPLVPVTGPIQTAERETKFFLNICDTVKSPDLARLVYLTWTGLYPTHLISQPSLESLTNLWARVIDSNIPPHCEVISTP